MNHYEVLGVRKNASQEDIKKAYKNLVKKYHPDIYAGDKTFAEKKTAQINIAYDILSNPESRQAYDEEISPSTTYSYTPPRTQTSYDDYKHKYSSTNQTTYRRDGSEHDYSTYANYSRPYTDYHRSKTPNSNYTPNGDAFSSKVMQKVEKLSSTNKKKLIIISIIIYLLILIYCLAQTISILKPSSSTKKQPNRNTESSTPSIIENTVLPNNSFTNTSSTQDFISPNNSTSENSTVSPENSVIQDSSQKIDLYYYFTEKELRTMYIYFLEYSQYDISFEDFKLLLINYIQSGNY